VHQNTRISRIRFSPAGRLICPATAAMQVDNVAAYSVTGLSFNDNEVLVDSGATCINYVKCILYFHMQRRKGLAMAFEVREQEGSNFSRADNKAPRHLDPQLPQELRRSGDFHEMLSCDRTLSSGCSEGVCRSYSFVHMPSRRLTRLVKFLNLVRNIESSGEADTCTIYLYGVLRTCTCTKGTLTPGLISPLALTNKTPVV
jgi:hypothetical protein